MGDESWGSYARLAARSSGPFTARATLRHHQSANPHVFLSFAVCLPLYAITNPPHYGADDDMRFQVV
jgi:hypothetical protein